MRLCVACPACGGAVPLAAGLGPGPAPARCAPCGVTFDYRPRDVFLAGAAPAVA